MENHGDRSRPVARRRCRRYHYRRMPWAFDTHADVKRLQAAGINEPQAEAIVATVYKAFIAHASTKTDPREVQVLLGAVFQAVFDVRVLWVPPSPARTGARIRAGT